MILIAHLLAGAAIASKIKSIPLAIILSFFSHYLLDIIPHTEYSIKNIKDKQWQKSFPDFLRVSIDFSMSILVILIFSKLNFIILLIAMFAVLPDGLALVNLAFPNKLLDFHDKIHEKIHFLKNKKISNFWRVLSQVLVIIISIFLLKF